MKISESITYLLDTYNSIDIRAACYKKNNSWFDAIIVIRFRKEEREKVKQEQIDILKKHGEIKDELFQVILDAFPTSKWKEIVQNWSSSTIQFSESFTLNLSRRDFMEMSTEEPHYHKGFSIIDENWKSYHNSTSDQDQQVMSIVNQYNKKARDLRCRDIFEYLAKIFQISKEKTENLRHYIVIAPVYFKINSTEFTENDVKIKCEGYPENKIDFVIDFSKQYGNMNTVTSDGVKINNYEIESKTPFTVSSPVNVQIDNQFRINVYRTNGILLDTNYGVVSNYFPTKGSDTNPIFNLFTKFIDYTIFEEMLFKLQARGLPPNKAFERAITWILNLTGISAIRLEEFETIGQLTEKVSMDIIGSYDSDYLILANVTLSMPDTAMFETERNRRIILSKEFPQTKKFISIIFTPKSIIELQNEALKHEVKLIGSDQLHKILEFLKTGDIQQAREMIIVQPTF